MPALPLADIVYNVVTVVAPIVGVVAGIILYPLVHRWRTRRKGDEDVRASVRRLSDTTYGRRPTLFEKHPPPGLDTRVDTLEERSEEFARVLGEHTEMLTNITTKLTPNGGNTRDPGDLLLLIAKKLDIEVPDGEA